MTQVDINWLTLDAAMIAACAWFKRTQSWRWFVLRFEVWRWGYLPRKTIVEEVVELPDLCSTHNGHAVWASEHGWPTRIVRRRLMTMAERVR